MESAGFVADDAPWAWTCRALACRARLPSSELLSSNRRPRRRSIAGQGGARSAIMTVLFAEAEEAVARVEAEEAAMAAADAGRTRRRRRRPSSCRRRGALFVVIVLLCSGAFSPCRRPAAPWASRRRRVNAVPHDARAGACRRHPPPPGGQRRRRRRRTKSSSARSSRRRCSRRRAAQLHHQQRGQGVQGRLRPRPQHQAEGVGERQPNSWRPLARAQRRLNACLGGVLALSLSRRRV